jgi:septum formation protein
MKRLLLASGSPRRRQLLHEAGFAFDTFTPKISETLDKNLMLDDQIKTVALDKARAVTGRHGLTSGPERLILASDTVVVLDNEVLGKPVSVEQAIDFLTRMSARVHLVKTSICLLDELTGKVALDLETSKVTFRELSQNEIRAYVASGEPMDKAGAYGIQGAGGKFIFHLDGNLDNVMGLSITLLKTLLHVNGWIVEKVTPS